MWSNGHLFEIMCYMGQSFIYGSFLNGDIISLALYMYGCMVHL